MEVPPPTFTFMPAGLLDVAGLFCMNCQAKYATMAIATMATSATKTDVLLLVSTTSTTIKSRGRKVKKEN